MKVVGSHGIQNVRSYGHVIFSSTKASKGETASKAQDMSMNIDCLYYDVYIQTSYNHI